MQKLTSSYERVINLRQKTGTEQWSDVHFMYIYTAEPVDKSVYTLFKHTIVYNYTRTSKQKFPFVSEAKEGYPFYSNDVVFMYAYFTTSSYEITNKSCSVI